MHIIAASPMIRAWRSPALKQVAAACSPICTAGATSKPLPAFAARGGSSASSSPGIASLKDFGRLRLYSSALQSEFGGARLCRSLATASFPFDDRRGGASFSGVGSGGPVVVAQGGSTSTKLSVQGARMASSHGTRLLPLDWGVNGGQQCVVSIGWCFDCVVSCLNSRYNA